MLYSYQLDRSGIVEWGPVVLLESHLAHLWPLKLMLLTMMGTLFLIPLKQYRLSILILLLLLWQGLAHQKLLALALVAMGFYVPMWFQASRWQPRLPTWASVMVSVILPLLLFIQTPFAAATQALAAGWPSGPHTAYDETWRSTEIPPYPVGALNYLEQIKATGKIWVPFEWGEFVLWQMYPSLRVSMDARYEEVYSQAQFVMHQQFKADKFDPAELKPAMQPDWLLLIRNPRSQSIGVQGLSPKNWRMAYRDDVSLLLQRTHRPRAPRPPRLDSHPPVQNKQALPVGDLRRFRNYPLQ